MDRSTLRDVLIETLLSIAPEVDAGELDDQLALRKQVDLDSMDWLNFIIGLHEKLGVDIPEADYHKLVSIETIINYLMGKLKG